MTTNDHPSTICRTCQRALDMIINDDGVHYIHTPTDPDDHTVQPIPAPPGWSGTCDFCTLDSPNHVLPARDFTVPGLPSHVSIGNWAVCEDCAGLIRAERWDWLITRVVARFHSVYGYPMPTSGQKHLARLYRSLRLAVTGALRPITDIPPTGPQPRTDHG